LCDSTLKYYRSKTILIAICVATSVSVAAPSQAGTASAGATCTAPNDGPPLCLTGTVLAPGTDLAMVERAGSSAVEHLHQGDTILDWRLVEIGPKYIKLGQGEKLVTLDLAGTVAHAGPESQATAQPVAAKPAPQIKQGPMKRVQAWAARGEREPPAQ
jgi:hypothetical protein